MSSDLAELRRQKIIKNSERRLQLLMGIKNSDIQISKAHDEKLCENENVSEDKSNKESSSEINCFQERDLMYDEPTTESLTKEAETTSEIKKEQKNSAKFSYTFNGHSNTEIIIFFTLALLSSAFFYLKKSDLIYHNVLLPFFSLEAAHLIVHLKYLPATSSQFQLFRTLLQLCGISQKSLKKLMVTLNFLFILIDNFAVYILSFVLINLLLNTFFVID